MFDQSSFMPHGHCYLWQPALVWTHFASDLLIGFAYVSISLTLYWLVRSIRLPFSPIFIAFGVFIGACGLTHFMEVWTLWHPDYWTSAFIKAVTAAASVATAIVLFPLRPRVVALAETARLSERRRQRLEEANVEMEALYRRVRESDEQKTRFFANVSHELRTPIALILGPLEQIAAHASLTGADQRALTTALRNGKTLLKQVNDLLDISKLEAGRMKPRYSRVDLAELLRFVSAHFEAAMQARQISFSLDAPERAPAEVDSDKIQRVYMNLLSNAVKFAPVGGRVRASINVVGDEALILIADSGPGVDASVRDVIFERFSQGEAGTNRRFGGTGLGLAIVRDFIEMHGGSVTLVESELPGAAFLARLPLSAPVGRRVAEETQAVSADPNLEGTVAQLAPADESPIEPTSAPGRPTALVCEDNPDMNRFVAEVLSEDFNVTCAFDGREGLAKARAIMPDLVVSDLMMPNLGGDQLVAELKSEPTLRNLPVLLLSARSDDGLRVDLLRKGASDYVMKPFAAEELRARALNLLAIKRARDVLQTEIDMRSENVEDLARELAARKRQVEAALKAASLAREQAEKADQAKGLFLNLVSHELNTPLTAMLLSLQLLEARELENASPRARVLIDHLSSSSRQLKNLVDGLLQFLRTGTVDGRVEATAGGALVRDASKQVVLMAERKGLQVRTDIDDDVVVETDPGKAQIILSNLAMNAVKFTESGFVEIGVRRRDDAAEFWVRDTGPGIDASDAARIFEPFERVEPLARKSVPGVGLGLSIARQLAGALNGEISLRSEKGVGSEFTFRAPLARPPDAQA